MESFHGNFIKNEKGKILMFYFVCCLCDVLLTASDGTEYF